jgi:predicted DNA-binding transcriptional regulator AlpA
MPREQNERPARLGWSINEYCDLIGISRGTFYNRRREGRGPRIMKVGGRRIVTPEAHEDYRIQCEAVDAA